MSSRNRRAGVGPGLVEREGRSSGVLSSRSVGMGLTLTFARAGSAVSQFCILIVAARLGGPRLVGLLSLGIVLAQYFATLTDFGSADLFLLRIGQGRSQAAYDRAIGSSKLALSLAGLALVGVVGVALQIPWPVTLAAAFVGSASGVAPWLTARLVVVGRPHREPLAAWVDAAIALLIAVAVLGSGYRSAWLVLTGVGASRWLGNLMRFMLGGRRPGGSHTSEDSDVSPRRLLGESLPFFLFAATVAVFAQVDALILFPLAGSAAVGVYQLAWRLVYFIGVIGESLVMVLLPRVARRLAEGDASRAQVWHNVMLGFAGLGIICALGIWVFMPPLVLAAFGTSFVQAADLTRILGLALMIRFAAYGAGLLLTASDRQTHKLTAALTYTPLSVGVFTLGAVAGGAAGVAAARILAEVMVLVSYLWFLTRNGFRKKGGPPPPVAREGYFGEVPPGELASSIGAASCDDVDVLVERALSESLGVDWSDRESMDSVKAAAMAPVAHLLDRARVLDAGCGLGAIARWMAWAGASVLGVDRVEERAAVARQRLEQVSGRGSGVAVGDLTALPVATGSIHLVTCVGVLEWVPAVARNAYRQGRQTQVAVLREFARVLRADGVVVVAIENRFGLPYLLGRRDEHTGLRWVTALPRPIARLWCRVRGRRLAYTHSRAGMRRLARDAGLLVEEIYAVLPHYSCPTIMVASGRRWASAVAVARRVAPVASGRSLPKRLAWRLALGPLRWLTRRLAPSLVVVMRAAGSDPRAALCLPLAVVGPRGAGRSAHVIWENDAGGEVVRIPLSPRQNPWIRAALDAAAVAGTATGASRSPDAVFVAGPRAMKTSGDLLFASSTLVEGENVANVLARGAWRRRRAVAVRILREVSRAVPFLPHHGDLSPLNLLLTEQGRVAILDWETSGGSGPQEPGAAAVDLAFLGIALANYVEPGRVGTVDSELLLPPSQTRLWPDVREVWSEAERLLALEPGTIEALVPEVLDKARERQRLGERTPLVG